MYCHNMHAWAATDPAPPACQGHKAAGLGYHLLFSSHLSKSVAFQQPSVLKLWLQVCRFFCNVSRAPKKDVDYHDHHWKIYQFQACKQKCCQGVQQNTEGRPEIIKKRLLWKLGFESPGRAGFDPNSEKVTCKRAWQTKKQNVSPRWTKSSWNRDPKLYKIAKKQTPEPTCAYCCSHGRPGCPPSAKMVPRMPKWRPPKLLLWASAMA